MTTQQIKEQLAIHYAGAIASKAGYKLSLPTGFATGVDVTVNQIENIKIYGKTRQVDIGAAIDFQLKTTTETSVIRRTDKQGKQLVVFDLEAKNYLDLLVRLKGLQTGRRLNPLYLLLLVLPEDESKWLEINADSPIFNPAMHLGGLMYWFLPDETTAFPKNRKSIRVSIPAENVVNPEFFHSLFQNSRT